jgi:D-xylose 1-dehydrogenase
MRNPTAIYPSLADRVVFITGGGSGIGAAMVETFGHQKAKVAFVDIDVDASQQVTGILKNLGVQSYFECCDIRDTAALQRSIEATRRALGPITILINNAARDDRHATEDVTPEYWDERFAVNLKHQFFASQAVLPDMKAAHRGSIINLVVADQEGILTGSWIARPMFVQEPNRVPTRNLECGVKSTGGSSSGRFA